MLLFQIIRDQIKEHPDVYLDEIRDIVKDKTGRTLGLSTIWRHLARVGYTLKKVRFSFFSFFLLSNKHFIDHKECQGTQRRLTTNILSQNQLL